MLALDFEILEFVNWIFSAGMWTLWKSKDIFSLAEIDFIYIYIFLFSRNQIPSDI